MQGDHFVTSDTATAAYLLCKQHPLIVTKSLDGRAAQFTFPATDRLQRDLTHFYDRDPDAAVQPLDFAETLRQLKTSAIRAVEAHRKRLEINSDFTPSNGRR